jgi:streptogramin lyase
MKLGTTIIGLAALIAACSSSSRTEGVPESLPDATSTGGASDGGAATETGPATGRLDVAEGEHVPEGEDVTFSYIWISDTYVGEVVKIDTTTVEAVARYKTHAGPYYSEANKPADVADVGMPSRTSVNLRGDVAVANRSGGVVKIYARDQDCETNNANGEPGLQTSTGPNDVRDWGDDDCVAWEFHYPNPGTTVSRPVAWTAGEKDPDGGDYVRAKLWTAAGGPGFVNIVLLDGTTGEMEMDLPVPYNSLGGSDYGIYGGAVDSKGDFWFTWFYQPNKIGVARLEQGTVEIIDSPTGMVNYGIAVDENDRIWVSSAENTGTGRYDALSGQWDTVPIHGWGLQPDGLGKMWIAVSEYDALGRGLGSVDTETLEILDFVPNNPEETQTFGRECRGVSIDVEGYVWFVPRGDTAWRYDPDTLEAESYTGFDHAYTYSDMTGHGLEVVTEPIG